MAAGDINDPLSNIPNIVLVDQSAASAAPGAGYGRLEVVNGVLGVRVGTGAWVPILSLAPGTPGYFVGYDADTGLLVAMPPPASSGSLQPLPDCHVQVAGSNAASVTLPTTGSLAGTHKSLLLVWQARGDTPAANTTILLTLNGDGGSNYDWHRHLAYTTTSASQQGLNAAAGVIAQIAAANATANHVGSGKLVLPNYAGTTFYKSWTAEDYHFFNGDNQNAVGGGDWHSTAAVTSLTLTPGAGNFLIGSTFTLYALS